MQIEVQTKGNYDFIDITSKIADLIKEKKPKAKSGIIFIFIPGSTAALTTLEYEKGVIKDLINVFEKIAPAAADYEHHKQWGDHNGAAHIKSALIGTDLVCPFADGELLLGTWQQIVLIDFDEKPRTRKVIVNIIEEK